MPLAQPLWNNAATCVCEVVAVIDPEGYRPKVWIILKNDYVQVLWAR
ncbi:RNA pyrophosphohydrolase, partial [Pseudomonas sivasensis]